MIYYLHFRIEKISSRRYASNEAVMNSALLMRNSDKGFNYEGFDEPLNSDSCTIYDAENETGFIITRFRDDDGIFHTGCDMYIKAREGLIHD
jgi:hypothetical protein